MIFVTGDTHGLQDFYKLHIFAGEHPELTKEDFVIIAGDFGGATSIDKFMRREGISWWKQEVPSFEELDEGFANLKRYNNKVDYIITHSCGQRALTYPQIRIYAGVKTTCPESHLLSNFEDRVTFKHWFFGHFHIDAELGGKYTALINKIVRIDEYED